VYTCAFVRHAGAVSASTRRVARTADFAVAVERSALGGLPAQLLDRLTEGAVVREVRAGETIHQGGIPPFFELVLAGLLRAFVIGPDGRTMTIRYCRACALMGTGTLFNPGTAAQGSLSAVVDSSVLAMRPAIVRNLAGNDVQVTNALLRESSARVAEYINELQASAMASVRQRVARHLLDLVSDQPHGGRFVVQVSQQALAEAVGTVRELVVRVLHDMREQGLVSTGRGQITLLDPERLAAETYRGW